MQGGGRGEWFLSRAYLSLGSNMGDRLENLRSAVSMLSDVDGLSVERVSGVYRSEPVGVKDQREFLNAVIMVETELEPLALLRSVLEIEKRCGRKRDLRWGPRTLDIDILLFDGMEIDLPELSIPHPMMITRRFVLEPLVEIAPDAVLPDGVRAEEVLGSLRSDEWVHRDPDMDLTE